MPSAKTAKSNPVSIIRVYDHEHAPPAGAYRVLVDRLWPRGIKKSNLELDDWCKDVTPSADLRKWYGHDPEQFAAFRDRYREELTRGTAANALRGIVEALETRPVVLYTAVKAVDISAAAVLIEILKGDAPLG